MTFNIKRHMHARVIFRCWQSDLIFFNKIVKVASSNSAHRETPQGPVIKEGQHPFDSELRSLCMHKALPVEA
jgi:hypothetical protein